MSLVYKRVHESIKYRLRTFASGRFASYCRPVTPLFVLTELCNARCIHCDIWKNRGTEDSPTVAEWKTVLRDLRGWLGPTQVVFTGGEALLKPFTTDLVEHASASGLFAELLTHGYWDDQSRIEKLVLARPWRITISVDGIGELHTRIRGRENFWAKTSKTIRTIQRVRKAHNIGTTIRLKTVIMSHNLDGVSEVARFARQGGMEVFYQPIEQNYNTPEDAHWFEHSDNWLRDTDQAVRVVESLIQMKKEGYPIANSFAQLEAMIPYFRHPGAHRISTQEHRAHEHRPLCSALTMMQLQANGDVTVCTAQPPVRNIKTMPIREIWKNRPQWWKSGCCLDWRLSAEEKAAISPAAVPAGIRASAESGPPEM